jgi:hypothetical protein
MPARAVLAAISEQVVANLCEHAEIVDAQVARDVALAVLRGAAEAYRQLLTDPTDPAVRTEIFAAAGYPAPQRQ